MLFYPENVKINYEQELNQEQLRVVKNGDGPCLVLAGAGSGKTRTLIYRVAYLLEKGVPANRILLVTFTNKAANEMLTRVEKILKYQPTGLWGGTFHSVANRILRLFSKHLDLTPNFNILDQEDSKNLVKNCFKELNLPADKHFPKSDLIHKIISLAANFNQPIEKIIARKFDNLTDRYLPYILQISQEYVEKKKRAHALDFDDLLFYWNKLLEEKPQVREKLAHQFQYILVDEYQDTNHIQGQIVKNLAGAEKNILVVGDDAQSIYSFRGADVNNILKFPEEFPNCQIFKLETNYRSTPEILALANHSIKQNKKQFKKDLKTNKENFVKPMVIGLIDTEAEANFIISEILRLHDEEGLKWQDIAILFRSHFQSLETEMVFNKEGVPYEMRGGLRFFEQAHVKDVLAYLKVIANHKDEIAWQRLLLLQAGIGDVNARKVFIVARELKDLADVLAFDFSLVLPNKVFEAWRGLAHILKALLATDKTLVNELIKIVLHSDYLEYLKANYDNAEERSDDLKELVVFAGKYDSLSDFLADVALSENFKKNKAGENKKEDAVILSTIHQAKGLEWDTVFVLGLVDGQFPHAKIFQNPIEIEEERRLFYVATTRAENRLYLTYSVFNNYGATVNKPSQFIRELPEEVYEKMTENAII
ncbi:ATP-dependent DNA helicase [Candidatus Kuenenbacteria bacterium CG23_combo_of_CG06-09_8_20_14_all_36_9]|uniref:DNA 3'-5' helicase n=1 Tax=Candidatus Kuenenbacteria bacterium CG10_big_fil_rev_8_21_14_0_10_36_11 TaxID=1974618 RepID=A0A2M6WAL5_9BACT|nr:MAG: ATP-dependent DNA helicase [Candidatus Kuenenbacteria bacterium CG23_combo_of_CG06-09_8_20_14_all_36_9]PIT89715.1 MAG: ATP-dependent DNA helicase [Candidatus Kuenenbacteria bacterium CG10_big_fil_rev_8_21_14_0_10_36_11]